MLYHNTSLRVAVQFAFSDFVYVNSTQFGGGADMEKGADTRTLSAEILENCEIFLIVEDYAPLFSEENLFLVEMFDETFNIWHIYSL